jgi:hypothetical protein
MMTDGHLIVLVRNDGMVSHSTFEGYHAELAADQIVLKERTNPRVVSCRHFVVEGGKVSYERQKES